MKLTQLVYYVPYGYPRWQGCTRLYRQTRIPRDEHSYKSRKRLIERWARENVRFQPKERTNHFKRNIQIRKNFSTARYGKWY